MRVFRSSLLRPAYHHANDQRKTFWEMRKDGVFCTGIGQREFINPYLSVWTMVKFCTERFPDHLCSEANSQDGFSLINRFFNECNFFLSMEMSAFFRRGCR